MIDIDLFDPLRARDGSLRRARDVGVDSEVDGLMAVGSWAGCVGGGGRETVGAWARRVPVVTYLAPGGWASFRARASPPWMRQV